MRNIPAMLDPFWQSDATIADTVSRLTRSEIGKRILNEYLKDPQMQGLFIGLLTELEDRENRFMQVISETKEMLLSLPEEDSVTSSTHSDQNLMEDVESLSLTGPEGQKSTSHTGLSKPSKTVTFYQPNTSQKRSYSQYRTY